MLPGNRSAVIRKTDHVIWLQTLAVVAVYVAAVWGVYHAWIDGVVDGTVLGAVLAFAVVQSATIAALLVGLLVGKAILGARERRIARMVPAVRAGLVNRITALDAEEVEAERPGLDSIVRASPDVVERCAVELLASISGSALGRLGEVLEEIGILDLWRRRYRTRDAERRREVVSWIARIPGERGNDLLRRALEDADASVRLEAARGLLDGGGIVDIERIFHLAVKEPLLVRAILVEDLRPFATDLTDQAVPKALAGGDPRAAMVALEMIEAWEKSVVVPGVVPLLRHPRPEVRARALRVAPYVAGCAGIESEVIAGLADDHPEVRGVAARVAGRLRLHAAIPSLELLLHSHVPGVAVAAAYGLAEMGEPGADVLEAAVRANHSPGAAVALEALERVRTDRLRLARV